MLIKKNSIASLFSSLTLTGLPSTVAFHFANKLKKKNRKYLIIFLWHPMLTECQVKLKYFVLCKFAVWVFVFRFVKTFSSSSRHSHQTTLPDCLSMNASLTTYFKYPSELRSRKRKLSPERGVLADITNSTPKRYAVSFSNRSTGVTKQFTRMDPMNKKEVCAVLIMQLKGSFVYLNAKTYFSRHFLFGCWA